MTFQTELQAVKPDQLPRLCATVPKAREPLIEWDGPIDGFVFQNIYRDLRC